MSAATARPGRLQKEYRRQELIQAAFRRIAEEGFEGLRTRDVAREAGVNIATLHYYFPTKEALIRGVMGHAMGRFRSTLAPHGSSQDQLANHLRAVRTLMRNDGELRAVMGELALRSGRDPALARILREMNDSWHQTLRAMLRRAVRDGMLAKEFDSDAAASLIQTTIMSMALPSIPTARSDQAVKELERWLRQSSKQARIQSSK
jgi:AcrR family transcriptional regulator